MIYEQHEFTLIRYIRVKPLEHLNNGLIHINTRYIGNIAPKRLLLLKKKYKGLGVSDTPHFIKIQKA